MPKIDHGRNQSRLYCAADALTILVRKYEELPGMGGDIYILERVIETMKAGADSIEALNIQVAEQRNE